MDGQGDRLSFGVFILRVESFKLLLEIRKTALDDLSPPRIVEASQFIQRGTGCGMAGTAHEVYDERAKEPIPEGRAFGKHL
jgi:hypothetical protein